MIRLYLLGAIDLRDEFGQELRIILAQPKRLALIAYLAAAWPPGPRRRDTLLGLFWPELDQEHARKALNTAVHFLRQSLGEAALVCRSADELALEETVVWTDVRAFSSALAEGRLGEALSLYQGDLLPSFFVPDAAGFEEWLEQERAHLRRRAAVAAGLLADRHLAEGCPNESIDCARRAVELSNGDERSVRRLIALLDTLGDRAGALREYEEFARRLATEFDAEPSIETLALIERVRSAHPPASTSGAGPVLPAVRPSRTSGSASRLADATSPARRRMRARWVTAFTGLGLFGALVAMRILRPPSPSGLDPNLIAVAPFDVLDPALGLWREGAVDVLSRNLDGAGPLRTVSPTVAIRRWHGRADPGSAQALGQRTGAQLVLFGQVIGRGADSVRVTATLMDASRRRILSDLDLQDATFRMDHLLGSLTLKLLQELGRHRPGPAFSRSSIGTRPLPALKAFLRGEQFYRRMMWDSALAHFDHTIALDSGFALAHYRIAQTLGWGPEQSKRFRIDEHVDRAVLLSRGQTPRDSLLLVSLAPTYVGAPDVFDPAFPTLERRRLATLERASQLFPGDPDVWLMLGEARYHVFSDTVNHTKALDAFDRAIELDSTFGPPYKHVVGLALQLGDTARARMYAAAYRASAQGEVAAPSLLLESLLLDPSAAGSTAATRLLDTIAGHELWLAAWSLASWLDSAETSIWLARKLVQTGRKFFDQLGVSRDSITRQKFLARMLAFRGHLQEAHQLSPPYGLHGVSTDFHPFPPLALLGTVPAESAAATFARLLRADPIWPATLGRRRALPWWKNARDTISLVRFAQRADSAARRHPNPVARDHLRFDADAARAYITLVRGDSAAALQAFSALSDSLCALTLIECFYEKLTQASLAAALGEDRSALELYDRWLSAQHLNPIGVLASFERGEVAERLGERDKAIKSYRYVADAWRNSDPALQSWVAKARDRLEHLLKEESEKE